MARRPRLVAGRQTDHLQQDQPAGRRLGIGTLETVDVATGQVRVVLGPWKRSFTAGARYSPDGARWSSKRFTRPGAARTPTSTRSPSSSHSSTLRVLTSECSPTRGCSPPRPTGARTGRASCTPRSPSRTVKRRTCSGSAPGAANRLGSPICPQTGATPRIRPGCRTAVVCCSAAGSKELGSPKLLTVGIDGSGLGSAFGDDVALRNTSAGATSALTGFATVDHEAFTRPW